MMLQFFSRPFPLLKKVAVSYSYTCISSAKNILEGNTQAMKVMLSNLQRKENWDRISPFLSNRKPQPSFTVTDLGNNCLHTPMSSMSAEITQFSPVTGAAGTEIGVWKSLNKRLSEQILRSLAVLHLCWSAVEGWLLRTKGTVQQRGRCMHLLFFFSPLSWVMIS